MHLSLFVSTTVMQCIGIRQTSLAHLLVQNSALLFTQTQRRKHIGPNLTSLYWLSVHYRINFKLLLFVFKCLNKLASHHVYLSCFSLTAHPDP